MAEDRRLRRALAAVALVPAALLALVLWPRGARDGAPGPGPPPVAAASPPAPSPGPGPPDPEPKGDEDLPEPVRRYLERTVYPPTSGRLTEEHVDLLHPNRRHERPRPVPDTLSHDPDAVVQVLFTADRYYYEGGQTAEVVLSAWRGEEPIRVAIESATAVAEGRSGAEGDPVPVSFAPRDDRLEARLPLSRFRDHHGPILLAVELAYEEAPDGSAPGGTHREELRLFHTPTARIPARVTPELRDSVRDGSLRLDVGVDVREPGFYRFDANVFGPEGQPVAFAMFKGELDAGAQSVPLEVFGRVLRDAGVPGPYEIRDVRGYRFLDGQYPDRELLSEVEEGFTTDAYPLEAFSDEAWTSEHKQKIVRLMLEDAERGISLDVPPAPGSAADTGSRPPDDDHEPQLPSPTGDEDADPSRRR